MDVERENDCCLFGTLVPISPHSIGSLQHVNEAFHHSIKDRHCLECYIV